MINIQGQGTEYLYISSTFMVKELHIYIHDQHLGSRNRIFIYMIIIQGQGIYMFNIQCQGTEYLYIINIKGQETEYIYI